MNNLFCRSAFYLSSFYFLKPFSSVKGRPTIGGISASKTISTLQSSSLRNEDALPPMDESVVSELSQPNMPTFQEFHAKVLGENQNKRRLGK